MLQGCHSSQGIAQLGSFFGCMFHFLHVEVSRQLPHSSLGPQLLVTALLQTGTQGLKITKGAFDN